MNNRGKLSVTGVAALFALVALSARVGWGGDLWVSPTGADSNAGTQGAPLRSVQAAVDKAPAEGCVIHLAEGSYFVTSA